MAPSKRTTCTLITVSGAHELRLGTAENFLTRLWGLMLAAPLRLTDGLLITQCSSVHSAFMRYPIDVVYLDRHGVVTRCVRNLKPWRVSHSCVEGLPATHTLELAAGSITAFGIAPGDRLSHPFLFQSIAATTQRWKKQRGSAMIEFAVVGPLIVLLGLGTLQYGMVFFAKNQINYASFMAAREGAMAHADIGAIEGAYTRALAPMYGGGESLDELAQAAAKAAADMAGNIEIEMLNPTKESFGDWNNETLQTLLKTGTRHVIPNSNLAARLKKNDVGAASGQSLQDANLLKLKITHGYLPKVPIIGKLYLTYLKWADPHTDEFQTQLITAGRIPVVTHVTVEMQSDAIEPDNPISTPGSGNGGKPADPGTTPVTRGPAPDCTTLSCRAPSSPPDLTPACNEYTDPNRCESPQCVPTSQMCCIPPQWTPIP